MERKPGRYERGPAKARGTDGPACRSNPWHPGRFRGGVPSELGEWLAFAVLADPASESPLRALIRSYEVFAASEGHAAISEIGFVRHLEALGVRRRGATFLGLRLHATIPPLRLLTRLEMFGFRFAMRDGELAWRGPGAVSDLEQRVIERHRGDLILALTEIEESREIIRGRAVWGTWAGCAQRLRSRCAA